MQLNPLTAVSPLDGRYASKLEPLRSIASEFGYMKYRVQVELAWFEGLSELGLPEFPALSADERQHLQRLVAHFSAEDAQAIKDIEKTTNHDVKAVEYWIRGNADMNVKGAFDGWENLQSKGEFVHFACTSEDINNTSHALQLKALRNTILLPTLDSIIDDLKDKAKQWVEQPMLSRTHGQTASPSTVGKEIANVIARLSIARERIANVPLRGKMNGAVGNYSAHTSAYPDVDWPAAAKNVVENKLGLQFQPMSTQIEPHDYMAELFDAVARCNTILIDFARDIWTYISLGYFKQKLKDGEIGSSTMPHKVNPIDFENAEGNFGLANALLRHLSEKLPISRMQRDLTDSTVLRNLGVALGYTHLAHTSLQRGLGKLELNAPALNADLEQAWEVLAEPIQTVMRRYAIAGAYEKLKAATRGKAVAPEALQTLINGLDIPEKEKNCLLKMQPSDYVGMAAILTNSCL